MPIAMFLSSMQSLLHPVLHGRRVTHSSRTSSMHTSPCAARGRRKRSSAAAAGRQEVDAFGRARAPTLADLAALPFLDACWTESLRLYGPGVSILREAAADQRIGGHFIPKGTALQARSCSMSQGVFSACASGRRMCERQASMV